MNILIMNGYKSMKSSVKNKGKYIVDVWESKIGNCLTVCQKGIPGQNGLEPDAKKLRTLRGKDYNDVMQQHYTIQGWGKYKPF